MQHDWSSFLTGSAGTALVWAIVTLIRVIARRGVVKVQAADQLADSAVQVLQAVRADSEKAIAQARRDASDAVAQALQDVTLARRDADDARREANTARSAAEAAVREAEAANALLRGLAAEIWAPSPSIERLRLLVGGQAPPPSLGGPS